MNKEHEIIPVFSGWLGSWQLSISRQAYDAEDLAVRYDQVSSQWAETVRKFGFPSSYKDILQQALILGEKATHNKKLCALDCGIGTGDLTLALSNIVGARLEAHGIDISSKMLSHAKIRLDKENIQHRLIQMDIQNSPYPDQQFDLVMCAHLIEHIPTPITAIKEMSRVLKPGGMLICFVTKPSFWGAFIHMKWRTHFVKPSLTKHWLRKAGLSSIQILPISSNKLSSRLSYACVGFKPA